MNICTYVCVFLRIHCVQLNNMLGANILDFLTSRLLVITSFFLIGVVKCHDVWEQDLSKDMQIGLADGGYEKVRLRCGADAMQVDVITDEDFDGVIYTRGSFYKKQPPCFLDPGSSEGRSFSMKIPLDKCQTLQDGDVYSNVVVVQYDKDLIMPGDAAFNLECDFSQPRDVTVSANFNGKKKLAASRITLTDADPAAHNVDRHKRSTVESPSDTVEITPEDVKQINLLR